MPPRWRVKLQINVLTDTTHVLFKMRYIFSHKTMITATRERDRGCFKPKSKEDKPKTCKGFDVLLTVHLGIYLSQHLTNLMRKILFHNKFYFMPLHVSSTCAHHQEVKIALHSLWYHHTYRWFNTAGFVIPDGCITHIEFYHGVLVLVYLICLFCVTKPIGVMIPEVVWCNFDLLMMSTRARNMQRHEI